MNSEVKLLFIFCLILNLLMALRYQAAECPANELHYNSTSPSPMCDANCQNLQRRCPLTADRPVPGCYCKPNYARNLQQRCIPQQECVRDCDVNESAIAPLLRGCEKICPTSATGLRIASCYRIQERRCVCSLKYCRNRRGQCAALI